jgi:hypothetical protein
MSIGPVIAVGAVTGLALGIVIGLITDLPWPPRLGWCSVRWAAGFRVGIARRRVPLPHACDTPPSWFGGP